MVFSGEVNAGGTPPALGTSGGELELARVGHGRFNGIDEDRVRDQTLPPQGSWVPDTAAGHAREVGLDILRNFSILKDTSDTLIPVVISGSPRRRGERMANPAGAIATCAGGVICDVHLNPGRAQALRPVGLGRIPSCTPLSASTPPRRPWSRKRNRRWRTWSRRCARRPGLSPTTSSKPRTA